MPSFLLVYSFSFLYAYLNSTYLSGHQVVAGDVRQGQICEAKPQGTEAESALGC